MFWKKSPKSQKRPKNKRFSRRLKNAESVAREEEKPNRNGRSSILRVKVDPVVKTTVG
jgi:hypothetical protein